MLLDISCVLNGGTTKRGTEQSAKGYEKIQTTGKFRISDFLTGLCNKFLDLSVLGVSAVKNLRNYTAEALRARSGREFILTLQTPCLCGEINPESEVFTAEARRTRRGIQIPDFEFRIADFGFFSSRFNLE